MTDSTLERKHVNLDIYIDRMVNNCISVLWSVFQSCDQYFSHVISISVMWSVFQPCDQYVSHVISISVMWSVFRCGVVQQSGDGGYRMYILQKHYANNTIWILKCCSIGAATSTCCALCIMQIIPQARGTELYYVSRVNVFDSSCVTSGETTALNNG